MDQKIKKMKRYNLVMPYDLWDEVEKVAKKRHETVKALMMRYFKLGLLVEQKGWTLVDNNVEPREIIIL